MPDAVDLGARLRQAAVKIKAGTEVAGLASLLEQAAALLAPADNMPDHAHEPLPGLAAGHHQSLILEADGGSRGNPGPSGAGAVLLNSNGEVVCQMKKFLGRTTNNVAEYQGLLMGLGAALQAGAERLEVRLDSELLVKQLNGAYQVRSPHLKPLYEQARRLLAGFAYAEVKHIPRERNSLADALANQAMDAGE